MTVEMWGKLASFYSADQLNLHFIAVQYGKVNKQLLSAIANLSGTW